LPIASPAPPKASGLFKTSKGRLKASFAANFAACLILGATFVWAAILKIKDPSGTLSSVLSYRILPEALAPGAALILPWLELWAGVFTLTGPGYFRRAGALILSGLLALFILLTAFNLARGVDFDCGCFGTGGGKPGLMFFLRDGALLALGLIIVFRRRIFCRKIRPAETRPAGA
jgi:hypothetical protein